MQKQYIIVDDNNNWLSTDTTEKEARKNLKKFVKIGNKSGEYEGMQVGDEVYLYEAVEITREKTY